MQGQVAIEVIESPQVTAGPGQAVCSSGPPISLNASPASGSWTAIDGGVLSGNTFLPAESGIGRYTLIYSVTGGNNCGNSDSLVIEVQEAPVVTVSDSSYCNTAGTVSLPRAVPTGGSWSGPGVVDAANGLFSPLEAGGAGNYTLTYRVGGQNGCHTEEPVSIGVVDPVTVSAGPDTSLCISDEPYDLSRFANQIGGIWSSASAGLNGKFFDPSQGGGGKHVFVYNVGSGNCAVRDSMQVTVRDPGPVEAGPGQTICADTAPLSLNGAQPAGGSWSGPGVSSGRFDPSAVGAGQYDLFYTITSDGCQKSDTLPISVAPLPQPAFQVPAPLCLGSAFTMDNQSEGAVSYTWAFGDGQVSELEEPEHRYITTGSFNVRLQAFSETGCTATITQPLEVIAPPEAYFHPDAEEGCGGLEATFTNESSGSANSFSWDFGNGQSSAEEQPGFPIVFQAGRNDTLYTIRLQAENQCGADSFTDSVLVRAFPQVGFGFTVDTGCAPLLVEFANLTYGSPISYNWDFGNGQSSTDSLPEPQLFAGDTIPVDYTIRLIVENSCGTDTLSKILTVEPDSVQAFFQASKTRGCAPFAVQFTDFSTPGTVISWDFGDGNTRMEDDPVHTFTEAGSYQVKQHAANACAEDSTYIEIEVLAGPVPSFDHSPNLCSGQEIQFSNTSEPAGGSIWSFGTGDSSVLSNPTYLYDSPGVYTITLTATRPASGCSASMEREITISEPPEARFDIANATGCAPLEVRFSNTSSGGNYYQWEFGDGNSSVQPDPVHLFTTPGQYDVRLRVSNAAGCFSDTLISEVFAFPKPEAAFVIDKAAACGLPVTVNFQNQSAGAEGYYWQLGMSTSSTVVSPSQEYTQPGDYEVDLIASNQYGCTDTSRQEMRLYERPIADYGIDSARGCQPVLAQFVNYSRGNRFFWDFGDGHSSTERAPAHLYTEAGHFPVRLIAAYDGLCYDTLELAAAVEVLKQPRAGFSWAEERIDGGGAGKVSFINTSEQADTYLWDFGDGTRSEEEHPAHQYAGNGSWQVMLTAFTEGGCRDDTLIMLKPDFIKALHVPNAFAPDLGTGDARLFLPKGIGLKEYRVRIFSAYGELLWESTALQRGQPAEGWDGTLNGAALPQDVYVWKIEAVFEDESLWKGSTNGKRKYQKMGSVTLIR